MKCFFDFICALFGVVILMPLIIVGWVVASLSTKSNGFFLQERVGGDGTTFKVIKLKTMLNVNDEVSSVTALNIERITKAGLFLRKYKIDELPQLFNVLLGEMSFVGPRPDVPGYADKLTGSDRDILKIKPGITGYATLFFKNEEYILASSKDASHVNDNIIFPLKTKLNLIYMKKRSFFFDVDIILQTVCGKSVLNEKISPLKSVDECLELLGKINAKY